MPRCDELLSQKRRNGLETLLLRSDVQCCPQAQPRMGCQGLLRGRTAGIDVEDTHPIGIQSAVACFLKCLSAAIQQPARFGSVTPSVCERHTYQQSLEISRIGFQL